MEFSKYCLPPAANWYSSHILDCSDKFIAYGSNQNVIVLEIFKDEENDAGNSDWRAKTEWKRPKIIDSVQGCSDKAKVTAVKWSPNGQMIAVGTDDGLARVFTFENTSLKTKQSNATHKDALKGKITGLCWSNDETVVSGDDQGGIVVWDLVAQHTRSLPLIRTKIFVMRSHPFQKDIVGIGCKFGLAYVVNVSGKGHIVHKIKAHDMDILGIDWSTQIPEVFKDENEEEEENKSLRCLLAVSSRENKLSIWDERDASQKALLKMPFYKPKGDAQIWITLKWFKNSIVFSGAQGEVSQWNLDKTSLKGSGLLKSDGRGDDVKELHREHSRLTFCIDSFKDQILTAGFDRSLICYNMSKDDLEFNLPTFAFRITCVACNLVDPSIIAFGSGDGLIKIWKSSSTKVMFDYATVWQKGRCEISALTWHPHKEGMLAFATNEGRIGIVDALSPRPNPIYFDFKHKNSVYNLIYGPCINGEFEDTRLYSVGDSVVYMHPANSKSGEKPLNLDEVISQTNQFEREAPRRTELAFQPVSQKYLALGCDDGTVEIFAMPDLKNVATLKSFQKLIESIAWQPFEEGRKDDLLAVSSNEYDIHIWKLDESFKSNDTPEMLTKPDIVLEGHKLRVIQLNWNPYNHLELLSVSYDGTAQVWNVPEAKGLANFRGHTGRLYCGVWGPGNDKNLVITCGDHMALSWEPDSQPESMPIKKNNKVRIIEKRAVLVKDQADDMKEAFDALEQRKAQILNGMKNDEDNNEAKELSKDFKNRKINKKSFFPASVGKEAERKDLAYEDISALLNDNEDKDLHLAFYTSNPNDMEKSIEEELKSSSHPVHLLQWSSSSLKSHLEKQVEHLTDFHVSLAGSQDYATWKWACSTFAKQLEEKGNVTKASSYYLMVNEVDKAIKVLTDANFYRAAMTIAKSRFPSDHPMISGLYKQWAIQATIDGRNEIAAKCWLATKEYAKAANSLSKTSDGHSLRVSSILMAKAGEHDKAKMLALQAIDAFEKSQDKEGLEKMKDETDIEEIRQKITSLSIVMNGEQK